MIGTILNALYGCRHKRLSRPITMSERSGSRNAETYVMCLECGKQFEYDLGKMRVGKVITTSAFSHDGSEFEGSY